MSETLDEKLGKIERNEKTIIKMFGEFIQPNAPSYIGDLVLYGIANRALSLSSGFRSMIAARNFVCAAPMLRMQLDGALRLTYLVAQFSAEWYSAIHPDRKFIVEGWVPPGPTTPLPPQ